MSQSLLIINFYNYSSATFHLDSNGQQLQVDRNTVVSWPEQGAQLQANGGSVQCEITDNMNDGSTGQCSFWCCWNDGNNRFGVQIKASVQVLNIGDRPSWEVMFDQDPGGPIKWFLNGSDPSTPYTWPKSVGYKIVGTPTSSHQSLTVNVTIM